MTTQYKIKDTTMTTTTDYRWFICCDGPDWTAVGLNEHDEVRDTVEAANASSHIAAADRYSSVCEAVRDGTTDENVSADLAGRVVAALASFLDRELDPECVVVERIVIEDD